MGGLVFLLKSSISKIDKEAKKERESNSTFFVYKAWIILLVSSFCLWALHYLKFKSTLYAFVLSLENFFDISEHLWYFTIKNHLYAELFSYVWWASWHYIFFLFVPMLVIRFVFKEKLSAYAWQKGKVGEHFRLYVGIILFLIVFLSFVSYHSAFSSFYPFYHQAHRSWFDFLAWEFLYLAQFVALEFFFRGFLLQGLRVPLGSIAMPVMMMPYMMIHFPKLSLEAGGALFFGLILALLAFRSRSIWGGVAIHFAVALTLDISALLQNHPLPKVFFP